MAAWGAAERGCEVLLLDRKPLASLGHTWFNGVERGVFSQGRHSGAIW
ncbi:MAG: hypothetical protein SWK76_17820 [Actinomycetota bacterium]|nr:hypothetical protein [Actinomycetota bacterium]